MRLNGSGSNNGGIGPNEFAGSDFGFVALDTGLTLTLQDPGSTDQGFIYKGNGLPETVPRTDLAGSGSTTPGSVTTNTNTPSNTPQLLGSSTSATAGGLSGVLNKIFTPTVKGWVTLAVIVVVGWWIYKHVLKKI